MTIFDATMIAEGADGWDNGDLEEQREAWQLLVDTGVAWQLQGGFGRQAANLLQQGFIQPARPTERVVDPVEVEEAREAIDEQKTKD